MNDTLMNESLNQQIKKKLKTKKLLKMGHQVIGYPSLEVNQSILEAFDQSSIDFVELQIPFSDPVADGPLFVKANQAALDQGMTVERALSFIENMKRKITIPILIMTYYNIVLAYGESQFIEKIARMGVVGIIIPDAPYEETTSLWSMCKDKGIAMIPIITAYTSVERQLLLEKEGDGFVYCVPRTGVTGTKTQFDSPILNQISQMKAQAKLPVGVGFGIQTVDDLERLTGTCDIAIMGSVFLKTYEETGMAGVYAFLKSIETLCLVNQKGGRPDETE